MTKKIIACALLALLLVGGSNVASAQTATSSTTSTQLQALLDQLKNLQAQLAALQAAQQSVSNTVTLIRSLREGMTGEDIKALQAILAADPTVYPEGLITGFYGKLTSSAVKKFQEKHGIEQLGIVGPKTLKKLNEESWNHELSVEDSDDEEEGGRHLCTKVPPGHLIAPGWLRKHDGINQIVPPCQILPPGIGKKLGSTTPATTTPDLIAPAISAVSATGVTSVGANVIWTTNELSNSKVWYSTSTPVSTSTASVVSASSFVLSHSVPLSGLTSNTTYYYKVESSDSSGNSSVSSENSFTTSVTADTVAPIISSVSTNTLASTSAHVVWSTNEVATSKVWYSTTTPLSLGSSTSMVSSGSLVTNHDLTVSGLTASSTYYFVVVSSDAVGNTATSTESSFLTLSL